MTVIEHSTASPPQSVDDQQSWFSCCDCCCRCWEYIDSFLMAGATILSVIGAAVAFFNSIPHLATIFIITGLLCAYQFCVLWGGSDARLVSKNIGRLEQSEKELKTENGKLKDVEQALRTNLNTVNADLAQVKLANEALQKVHSETQATLTALQKDVAATAGGTLHKDSVALHTQCEALQKSNAQEIAALKKAAQEHEQERVELEQTTQELQEANQSLLEATQNLVEREKEVDAKITKVESQSEQIKKERAELAQLKADVQNGEHARLASQIQNARKELAQLTPQIETGKSQLAELAKEIAARRAELAKLAPAKKA